VPPPIAAPAAEIEPPAPIPPPPIAVPPPQKTAAAATAIASALEAAMPAASPVAEPPPILPPTAMPALPAEPPPAVALRIEPPPAPPGMVATLPAPIPEPEPPPIEQVPAPTLHPLAPERENRLAVYQLAAALVAAALFSVAPAVWDVVEYVQIPESQFVARWALVLLLFGGLQLAYAFYLVQLPDWTSVWVVTIYSLVLAAIYAAVLGLVLISREQGLVVNALQLADKLAGGKAILWCLCMVSLSTILAFFAGRLSARWRASNRLRHVGFLVLSGDIRIDARQALDQDCCISAARQRELQRELFPAGMQLVGSG
jgi:hypothetical protein